MKKIFAGLFNNWDSVAMLSGTDYIELKERQKFIKDAIEKNEDTETIIYEE